MTRAYPIVFAGTAASNSTFSVMLWTELFNFSDCRRSGVDPGQIRGRNPQSKNGWFGSVILADQCRSILLWSRIQLWTAQILSAGWSLSASHTPDTCRCSVMRGRCEPAHDQTALDSATDRLFPRLKAENDPARFSDSLDKGQEKVVARGTARLLHCIVRNASGTRALFSISLINEFVYLFHQRAHMWHAA